MKFGVDTGGTFTDVVARDAAGNLHVHKLPSTPGDPSLAIADGLSVLDASTSGTVVHGTTVATNALLERSGCHVALVTTAGFEDVLKLARQNRPYLYALAVSRPPPLTSTTLGVEERLGADGSVVVPLTEETVRAVVERLVNLAPDAVAVCLLHAYADGAHEQMLGAAIAAAMPQTHLSLSSELVGEIREYERASTTVVNAYVGPLMSRYIEALGGRLPNADIEVLQSSGGRASLAAAARAPVNTVLSGPAGGVVGALAAARELGLSRVITFDMGGTSTDVSLCEGEPALTYDATVAGLPLTVPTLDILTVGAGGGSIAHVDPGGALRVGPRSAGAVPGPAAYGRGGAEATVTDAHVVLGSLRPERFLGGEMLLDASAARAAIARLAESLGLGVEQTARGVLDVADASMVRAIKVICSRRGRDPRDFALVSFGGAGGLHACRLARQLGMNTVVVPAHPGLLSAHGMLHAPRTHLYAEAVIRPLEAASLDVAVERLRARAEFGSARVLRFSADLRYTGQSFEITLPLQPVSELRAAFDVAHDALYGYADALRTVELITVRLAAVEQMVEAKVGHERPNPTTPEFFDIDLGGRVERTRVLARGHLLEVNGPAVVTEYSGTTLVPADWSAAYDRGHLVIRSVR